MGRYGMDYGRFGGDRYDEDVGYGDRDRGSAGGMGYGGMRSDGWGSNWRSFPGEGGWYGEGSPGYPSGGYDVGYGGGGYGGGAYGGGFRGGQSGGYAGQGWGGYEGGRPDRMGQGGYGGGGGGYGGWETGYGGRDYEGGGGGWQQRGSSQQGGGRMRAAELMTENPECVTPDTTLADVARRMRELDVGIIPVVDSLESRRLQGVITDRDIAIRAVADGKDGKTKVSDCMTPDVETVNKNDPVREVLSVMQREQVRRVPVTDREGRLVGIIAQADLALDYGSGGDYRERMVENAIERISEPARPRNAEMAAQPRAQGGGQGGGRKGRGSAKGGEE